MDILLTHPMVLLGGVLQENPLYVEPDAFLQELKERKSHRPQSETLQATISASTLQQ